MAGLRPSAVGVNQTSLLFGGARRLGLGTLDTFSVATGTRGSNPIQFKGRAYYKIFSKGGL